MSDSTLQVFYIVWILGFMAISGLLALVEWLLTSYRRPKVIPYREVNSGGCFMMRKED